MPDIDAALLVELTDTGRTRDVDLSLMSADDVESEEQRRVGCEGRADLPDEPTVTIVERSSNALGPGRQVAPVVVGSRNARERIRDGLTVDHQDPRIAGLDDVGNVTLHYGKALAVAGQGLEHD